MKYKKKKLIVLFSAGQPKKLFLTLKKIFLYFLSILDPFQALNHKQIITNKSFISHDLFYLQPFYASVMANNKYSMFHNSSPFFKSTCTLEIGRT